MAFLSVVGPLVSGVMGALGTIVSYNAQKNAGEMASRQANFEAAQKDMQAQESRAAAQREMLEKRRRGIMVQSQLQSRAAASGAGATDPTVVGLGSDIAGRSEYQALMDMYQGESRGRGLEDQAIGARYTGLAEKAGAKAKGMGTILSGIGSFADDMGKAGSAAMKMYG